MQQEIKFNQITAHRVSSLLPASFTFQSHGFYSVWNEGSLLDDDDDDEDGGGMMMVMMTITTK